MFQSGVVVYARVDVFGQRWIKRENVYRIPSFAMTQYVLLVICEMVFVLQVSLPFPWVSGSPGHTCSYGVVREQFKIRRITRL